MNKASLAVSAVVALATAGAVPAAAAPWSAQGLYAPAPIVEQVQYRPRPGYQGPRGHYGGPRGHYNGQRGYYQRGRYNYYNGHRGYNAYRPGYRQYNGWWFPAAAFATGALIGGAIAGSAAPAPAYGGGNAHIQWCASQYRSYRASDNTFQPYGGPRQQCVSPY